MLYSIVNENTYYKNLNYNILLIPKSLFFIAYVCGLKTEWSLQRSCV